MVVSVQRRPSYSAQQRVHVLGQRLQLSLHIVFALKARTTGGKLLVPVAPRLATVVVLRLQSLKVDSLAHKRTSEKQQETRLAPTWVVFYYCERFSK